MKKVPDGIIEKYEKNICSQSNIIFLAFTAYDCISKKWDISEKLMDVLFKNGHF